MDAALSQVCPSCGVGVPAGSRYCPSCGALAPALPDAQVSVSAPASKARPTGAATIHDAPGAPPQQPVERPEVVNPPESLRPNRKSAAVAADPLIGQVIADRYKILSMLGRGGMGVVYKVEHIHIGKLMAMKLLSGELASDPHTVRRFRREAKAISKLTHPNTVQIFDFGQSANLAYLVMEYLPGKDLSTVIADEWPLSFTRVVKICAQIAASVSEAHEAGIIHRDIKPENVMIVEAAGQRDLVKVLDFGIAKLRDVEDTGAATQSGHLVGTPYYMAPEQIRAEPYDHRVDIYALGALMYRALAGVPPFVADTPMGVLTQHLSATLIPVRERAMREDLPDRADEIIAHAMQKDPRKRYGRMEDFRADLLGYLAHVGELETTDNLVMRSRSLQLALADSTSAAPATRGDVDKYEKRLSRTGWLATVLSVVAVVALFFAGYELWGNRPSLVETAEREPNDEPAQANKLRPGAPLQGTLGKRQTLTHGDADVYSFEVPMGEVRVPHLTVTALPNMDLVLDLARRGESTPLLVADSGHMAEPEVIPNYGLRGGTYYLRVRELWEEDRMPTENVSDSYTVTLRFDARRASDEREPNDKFEKAETIAKLEPRTGYLGWAGDRDVYCIAQELLPARLSVDAVSTLDVALLVTNRESDAARLVDEHGAGEGETVDVPTAPGANVCVTLSVRADPDATRADAAHAYALQVLRL